MLLKPFYYADSGSTSDGKKVTYPANMDKLMIPLCNAINKIPGLQTAWCCQGHRFRSKTAAEVGMTQVYVSIYCDDIKAFNRLTKLILDYNTTHTRRWVIRFGVYNHKQCGTTRVRIHIDLNPKGLKAKDRTYAIRELTKTINTWRRNHEQA